MGYVVQVWDPPEGLPRPTSLQEAAVLAERAGAQPAARSARLLALRELLLDRYPLEPDDDDEGARVWPDDALARGRDGPRWDIAIAARHVDEVQPFVVVNANRLGLHAFDAQAGQAHLADGTVFSVDDCGHCVKALAAWRQGDLRAAYEALATLAEAGNAQARWLLGTMYDEGGFVQCNAVVACALFCAATGWREVDGLVAAPGPHADGERLRQAREYRQMIGPEISFAADALMQRLLAPGAFLATLREAGGERDAQHAAGLEALAQGEHAAAAARLVPLAERGHAPAQQAMARLWATGAAGAAEPRHELEWTRAAARGGDEAAMVRMAQLFEEGVLVPRDLAQARGWHRRVVAGGRSARSRNAALAELRRLAVAADRLAHAAPDLAALRARARGGDGDAAYELACAQRRAGGVEGLHAAGEAPHWFRVAAERGHAQAQVELAYLVDRGIGVAPDAVQATQWYARAAAQGHALAQCRFGERLGSGTGIARDRQEMLRWFLHAARQRHGDALRNLGRIYASGLGLPHDPVAAQALYVLAARHGAAQPGFLGADEADPRAVRQLLAELEGGADLVDTLARRRAAQAAAAGIALPSAAADEAPAASAGPGRVPGERASCAAGGTAVPAGVSAAAMPASIPGPAARPRTAAPAMEAAARPARAAAPADAVDRPDTPRPALPAAAPSRGESEARLLERFEAEEHAREEAHVRAIRAAQPAFAVSLALMALVFFFPDGPPQALQAVLWFGASALAAWAVVKVARARGDTTGETLMNAVVMFMPVAGQLFAAMCLYRSWRAVH